MATERVAIAEVEVLTLRAPIDPPRGPSIAYVGVHEYVLVALRDADGTTGWGETYAVPGTAAVIAETAPLVLGGDAVGEAETLRRRVTAASEHVYAASAVAIALDDLRARRLGVPVHALYGGAVREHVRAYAAAGGYAREESAETTWRHDAEIAAANGFTALKLRIGREAADVEGPVLRRVAADLPLGLDLLVDGNGGYTLHGALAMADTLAELGALWFEEPLPQHDGYVGYPELRARLPLPLAGGEVLDSPRAALRLLAAGGVDIVQPEPVICGGIGEAIRIAQLAALHGVGCAPHTSGGGIGIAAALHVVATLPDATRSPAAPGPLVEVGIDANPFREGVLREPLRLEADGRVAIPHGPGLGVEIDTLRVRRDADARTIVRP